MRKLVLIPLLAAVSLPAFASGLYAVGSVGRASYSDGPSIPFQMQQSDAQTSQSQTSTGYKLQLGYQFNEHFALEGGYVNLGSSSSGSSSQRTGVTLNSSMKSQGMNLVAVGIIPIGERFSLFGKAGAIYSSSDTTRSGQTMLASSSNSTHGNALAPTWGLGAAYKLTENVALRAEFDQYRNQGDSNNQQSVNLLSMGVALNF